RLVDVGRHAPGAGGRPRHRRPRLARLAVLPARHPLARPLGGGGRDAAAGPGLMTKPLAAFAGETTSGPDASVGDPDTSVVPANAGTVPHRQWSRPRT